ncbi:hypothetical protein [Pedobacter sp. N23S346]|uniref:hypothetical protein n=1 Tax=Pedobacter sp. N23S346 TaxID=3402750 RepID=UPI003AC3F7DC
MAGMKYLMIIFSLYMTFLTLAPCQDKEDLVSIDGHSQSFTSETSSAAHSDEDNCPPFCTCACCSVSRDIIASIEEVIIIDSISIPYHQYQMPAIAEQSIEIYQPPQIV